jgi:drug/metabolite transporter (DMT)-like permease
MKESRSSNRILVFIVPFLWGSFAPVTKYFCDREEETPSVGDYMLVNFLSHIVCLLVSMPFVDAYSLRTDILFGVEVGGYLATGQLLQILGLGSTSAATNAILVQMSCLVVALLQIHVSRPSWIVSGLLCILGGYSASASVFYALHTVRLGRKTKSSAMVNAFQQFSSMCIIDFLFVMLYNSTRDVCLTMSRTSLIVLSLWNGIFPGALSVFLMSYFQRRISPFTASLAYTTEPFFRPS